MAMVDITELGALIQKDYPKSISIAPTETGNTSSSAYAIGDKLIWKGILYKAKTAIALNDTFVVNTNIEADDTVIAQLGNVKQALSEHWSEGGKNLFDFEGWLLSNGVDDLVINGNTFTFSLKGELYNNPYVFSDENTAITLSSTISAPSGSTASAVGFYVLDKNGTKVSSLTNAFSGSGAKIILDWSSAGKVSITAPQIERGSTATAYEPYAKPNTELTKDDSGLTANAFANGAVNLLENIGSSQVVGGVTFIVNVDKTITTNGASLYSNDYSTLTVGSVTKIKVGERYKLTGCPSGGGIQKYHMYFVARDSSNAFIEYWQETGEGINITIPSGTVKIDAYVRCYYDVNVDGKVFKPMITVADMPNSDYAHYVPYRMSNGELTDNCVSVNGNIKTAQSKSITIECFAVPCKPDANTVYVPILFPFILTNDSYSVSLVEVGAEGIGGIALTDCTVDRKKTGGFSFTISGNTNANNASMISVKYTLTY